MKTILFLLLAAGLSAAEIPAKTKVTFIATADGNPAPTFQWIKNGVDIVGATSNTFILPSLSASDAGEYKVRASNIAGSAESSTEIIQVISANPKAPREVKIQASVPKLP